MIINKMASSVDPDMVYYEQSLLNLHCLYRQVYWSTGVERGNKPNVY